MRWKQQAESVRPPSVESVTYKNAADFLFWMHTSESCKRMCTAIRKILNYIAGLQGLHMPVFMSASGALRKGYGVLLCPTRYRV